MLVYIQPVSLRSFIALFSRISISILLCASNFWQRISVLILTTPHLIFAFILQRYTIPITIIVLSIVRSNLSHPRESSRTGLYTPTYCQKLSTQSTLERKSGYQIRPSQREPIGTSVKMTDRHSFHVLCICLWVLLDTNNQCSIV